jgi:hypothetical protein
MMRGKSRHLQNIPAAGNEIDPFEKSERQFARLKRDDRHDHRLSEYQRLRSRRNSVTSRSLY